MAILIGSLVSGPAWGRPNPWAQVEGAAPANRRVAARARVVVRVKQPATCTNGFDQAQEAEKAGHLLKAKDLYEVCSKATCSSVLAVECRTRRTQIEANLPSVIPLVTNENGAVRSLVDVRLDGDLVTSKLDGRAIPVDPGVHEFSFSLDAGVFATKKVMIVEGQHNVPLKVLLRAADEQRLRKAVTIIEAPEGAPAKEEAMGAEPEAASGAGKAAPIAKRAARVAAKEETAKEEAAAPAAGGAVPEAVAPTEADASKAVAAEITTEPAPASTRWKVMRYTLGAVGLAAIGTGALLTYWGRKDNDLLLSQCSPSCEPSSVSYVHNLYVEADVALGVGLAAVVASWLFWSPRSKGTSESSENKEALMLDLHPTVNGSGAVGTVAGRF